MSQSLIARGFECKQLEKCLASNRSEFVIICGRRRIGKTFLVDSFFNKKYDFSFVGSHKAKTQIQLRKFAKAIKEYSGQKQTAYADWYEAFDALEDYLKSLPDNRKKVIFIDEMPWIDTLRSSFVSALEDFWNGWANRRDDIVLIASGSATSWMADNLVSNQGGLHNRITQRINLKPFTLKETEEYFRDAGAFWERYDILQLYMLTGGVPYYLNLLDPKLSVAQNIDRLCFDVNGELHNEYDELYNALFVHSESYIRIVELLYQHKYGLTRKEISKLCTINGTGIKTILKNLVQCDYIEEYALYGKKSTLVYRLVDFYTLFYLKFIVNNHNKDNQWWSHNLDDSDIRSWMGLSFELICMRHHLQIKKALGISGIGTSVSTWRCASDPEKELPGAQIDMLIERSDRVIHLCEMKFCEQEYNISNDYETSLRRRMGIFKEQTKTRKAIVHTFVTTYGLGKCKHNSIVHSEVTMDDLFNA